MADTDTYFTVTISDKKSPGVQNNGYRLMTDCDGRATYRDHPTRPPVKIAAFRSSEDAVKVARTLIEEEDVPKELIYVHPRLLEKINHAYQIIA